MTPEQEYQPIDDDIFAPCDPSTFNACVGTNSLHNLQTYSEGYIEASVLLLERIFEEESCGKSDLIVFPVLYSARHAVELGIKHALQEFQKIDGADRAVTGHSLKELWKKINEQMPNDRPFKSLIAEMQPVVKALWEYDPEGQDFRYPEDRDRKQTLAKETLIGLPSVYRAIKPLREQLKKVFCRVEIIVEDRRLGSYTKELCREELKELSETLPSYDLWGENRMFDKVKEAFLAKYSLSNSAFSRAIDFIKKHREFSGNIGLETEMLALSADVLEMIIDEAKRIREYHLQRSNLPILEQIQNRAFPEHEAFDRLKASLTPHMVEDLASIFYLSRANGYGEYYEQDYDNKCRWVGSVNSDEEAGRMEDHFLQVFNKTNFLTGLAIGLRLVGQPTLAAKAQQAFCEASREPLVNIDRIEA